MKFSANLTMMFGEYDFLDRFEHASKAGFQSVEYLSPYDYEPQQIKQRLDEFELTQSLFNVSIGDWNAGERGLACIPSKQNEFMQGVELALEYSKVLGNQHLHVMAGINPNHLNHGNIGIPENELRQCFIENIRHAAKLAQQENIIINLEPINNIDMPGYFLNYQEDGVAYIEAINESNVRLQFDCYHCQMMQGNIVSTFNKLQHHIEYIQIAGVPGRHEPNIGELNYDFILDELGRAGYKGYVGCEYIPNSSTVEGLDWMNSFSNF